MNLLSDEHGQASSEFLFLAGLIIFAALIALALIFGFFEGGVTLTNEHSQAEVRSAINNNGTQNLIT